MITLTINYDEATGNVNVNGPINNKGICYLMLECARDAVKDHVESLQRQQPDPAVVPVTVPQVGRPNGVLDFVRTRGKRKR
jgi:hypothetical protein